MQRDTQRKGKGFRALRVEIPRPEALNPRTLGLGVGECAVSGDSQIRPMIQ